MQVVDDWAVLSDGTIAIVRGQDYHVDWVSVDGNRKASPKIPFDWQRLSDDDKIAVIDSAKAAMERMRSAAAASPDGNVAVGRGGGGGGQQIVVQSFSMSGDGGGAARKADAAGAAMPAMAFASPSDLPDYRPAFGAGAAKADLDGNLWIRTSAVRAGAVAAGPIYDVVNSKGELVDRVQVPAGRQIVGFGRNGTVFMVARDDKGAWIEQTRRAAPVP